MGRKKWHATQEPLGVPGMDRAECIVSLQVPWGRVFSLRRKWGLDVSPAQLTVTTKHVLGGDVCLCGGYWQKWGDRRHRRQISENPATREAVCRLSPQSNTSDFKMLSAWGHPHPSSPPTQCSPHSPSSRSQRALHPAWGSCG